MWFRKKEANLKFFSVEFTFCIFTFLSQPTLFGWKKEWKLQWGKADHMYLMSLILSHSFLCYTWFCFDSHLRMRWKYCWVKPSWPDGKRECTLQCNDSTSHWSQAVLAGTRAHLAEFTFLFYRANDFEQTFWKFSVFYCTSPWIKSITGKLFPSIL